MSTANQIGIAANVLGAAITLLEVARSQQGEGESIIYFPAVEDKDTAKPIFHEINGTTFNLREVALVRKALNSELCLVIYLRCGVKTETAPFSYASDLERAYQKLSTALQSI